MKWIEIAVYTTDTGVELVSGALLGVGIEQIAIELSEQKIERELKQAAPYWDFADAAELVNSRGPCVKAYILDDISKRSLVDDALCAIKAIPEFYPLDELLPFNIEQRLVDDEDWANNWKQYYKPIKIGEKLLICPCWEDAGERSTRELIKLDPGMAFGTGAHHTTRLCLEFIEQAVKQGDRVLDIGCGSGILSIAALKLGVKNAVMVDIDPMVVSVVKENLSLNELDAEVYSGDILADTNMQQAIGDGYDVILANIVADVIIALSSQVKRYIKPGGIFVTSGIVEDRQDDVLKAIRSAGLSVREIRCSYDGNGEMGWVAIMAEAIE